MSIVGSFLPSKVPFSVQLPKIELRLEFLSLKGVPVSFRQGLKEGQNFGGKVFVLYFEETSVHGHCTFNFGKSYSTQNHQSVI